MVWPAIIAAAASIGGQAMANNKGAQAEKGARDIADAYKDKMAGIEIPELTPQQIEEYINTIDPSFQGESAMAGITTDPALREAQMRALNEMAAIGESGGMRLQDEVQMQEMQNQLAAENAGQQGAIMQNMAARGMGGGGMELAQRLQAQQSGSDRASQQGMDIAANAQNRALQAIMNSGQLGGNMQAQDFNQQSAQAQAQDAINQFNTGISNQANTQSQDIANMNVDQRNIARGQQNQIAQQNFGNTMTKMGAYGDAVTGSTNARKGTKEEERGGGMAKSASSFISGFGGGS